MIGVEVKQYTIQRDNPNGSGALYRWTDYYVGSDLLGSSEASIQRAQNRNPVERELVHGFDQHIPFELVPHFLVKAMGYQPKLISHIRTSILKLPPFPKK